LLSRVFSDPESVFKEIQITDDVRKALVESISRKMAPTPVKIRADFELTCFTYEGVDALKEALLTAKNAVNDEHIKVDVSNMIHNNYGWYSSE
jgi:translation initiation factor 2 subunit 1